MKVFLSFHYRQGKFAQQLMKALWNFGIEARADHLKFLLGSDIFNPKRLRQVTGDFDFVIPILSNAYVNDNWLLTELGMFKAHEGIREQEDGNRIILPIIFENCQFPSILKDKGRKRFDFRKPFKKAFSELSTYLSESRRVFVVMKMGDAELESVYKEVMTPVIKQAKYVKVRIDDYEDSQKISPRILEEIRRSDVVLADLTGERPNCYYEAGYAEALGKEVILTAKEGTNVHFDLKDNQTIFWKSPADFKALLKKRFNAIRRETKLREEIIR